MHPEQLKSEVKQYSFGTKYCWNNQMKTADPIL